MFKRFDQRAYGGARRDAGFTLLQMIFAFTVMGVISVFAFVGIGSARDQMRLSSSARTLAGYVEKARLDAIRRHGTPAATIQFLDTSRYNVTMDFNGNGVPTTRTISFDNGVRLQSLPPQPISFDWRGRTPLCTQSFTLINSRNDPTSIDISGSGDVTIDGDPGDVPTITYSPQNTNDTVADAVVRGTTAPPTPTLGDCSSDSGGSPPPPATSSGCGGTTVSPSLVTIRRNGGSTGTFTVQVGSLTTVTATATSNLRVTPASRSFVGAASFSVVSLNNSKGYFLVTFSSPCMPTAQNVQVRVTN